MPDSGPQICASRSSCHPAPFVLVAKGDLFQAQSSSPAFVNQSFSTGLRKAPKRKQALPVKGRGILY